MASTTSASGPSGRRPPQPATLFITELETNPTGSASTTPPPAPPTPAPAATAAISSFAPTSGPARTDVTIDGTAFTGASAVTFGEATARFRVLSATQIRASVPDDAMSSQIRVTTTSGVRTSAESFRVVPAITSLSPSIGLPGTRVVLTGTGFRDVRSVLIGEAAARFEVASPERINVTIPAGATSGAMRVVTRSGVGMSTAPFEVRSG